MTHLSAHPTRLRRELGVFGAVMLGLGSIIGTGVFVSIGIAAGVAGPAVMLAIVLAAGVATANALGSAQLAASHPVSGGTYEYGHKYLTPTLGFIAGWLFLCAKSASAATAALGFAGYFVNLTGFGLPPRAIAISIVVAITLVVQLGMQRSSRANVAILSVTLLALAAFVACGLPSAIRNAPDHLRNFFSPGNHAMPGGLAGLLQATALMFVAYTGYARIAVLGEEVHEPRRTIPRAIVITLVVTGLLYVAVGFVGVGGAGAGELYRATTRRAAAPLEIVAGRFGPPFLPPLVALGAMTAMLGVLLNLVLGLSRIVLAMGRRGDMPAPFARVSADGRTPAAAVWLVGAAIAALAALGSVRATWSFSAFNVLLYYALTNLAALRVAPADRLYRPWVAWVGLAACMLLVFWIEPGIWLAGGALIAVGFAWRAALRRLSRAG